MAAVALTGVVSASVYFPTAASGDAETTPESSPAWGWIRSQLSTGTRVISPSTILPDAPYAPSWTGPVSGTFELRDVAPPSLRPGSPIVITGHATLPRGYRGVVQGQVGLPSDTGRWVINAVLVGETGMRQANAQALVGADGAFSLDLSAAKHPGDDEWGFQVLDATHGYRQEGEIWPQPEVFDGLEVRAIVVTDTAYVIGSTPAAANHTFSFPSSRPGAKVFQLVNTTTGDVVAEHAPHTNLVRSYDGGPAAGRTFTYDQALAVITADAIGDDPLAARLTDGLMRLQSTGDDTDGAFVTSAAALNPAAASPEYRTGNHSIATYALLRRLRTMAPDETQRPDLVSAATRGVNWLLAQQQVGGPMDGLVLGGRGGQRPDGSFDPSTRIPWASTEHNLDAWHTLRLAATVLPHAGADAGAQRLEAAITSRLWDPVAHRFLQGWQPEGADPTPMLDLDSWGAIFLQKAGLPGRADEAMQHAQVFATTDSSIAGYAPALPTGSPLVWFEGSAGVALAQHRMGDESAAETTLDALAAGQLTTGAWPEATRTDGGMSMTSDPSVAATAWMLLTEQALMGHTTIWDD